MTPDEGLVKTVSWQLCYELLPIMLLIISHDVLGGHVNKHNIHTIGFLHLSQ